MAGRVGLAAAVGGRHLDAPDLLVGIIGERLQLAAHQHLAAAPRDLARRGFPHHAGTFARILEALDQGLDDRRRRLFGGRHRVA